MSLVPALLAPRQKRTTAFALLTALALLATGVVALVFQPAPVGAESLPKAPVDFELSPGQSVNKVFTSPKINGGGAVGDPDSCRNDPAVSLTCGAHRIKLRQLAPGYFMRIRVAWVAAGQQTGVVSVPDVDVYLFDKADANTGTEGATGAMPEFIKVEKPAQTEYDLVVMAFAGAIAEYDVTVSYVNEAVGPTPLANADINLRADQPPIVKQVASPMAGFTGQPGFYALVKQNPDDCRENPALDALCDVYRIKLDRNRDPEATNFVVFSIDWASTSTPTVVAAVAGLSGVQNPNLDLFVWDSADHAMERTQVGGEGDTAPERVAFTASQDEYDIVVQIANGANTNYTLTAWMSDEVFSKPFELLDPITGEPVTSPIPDGSGGFISPVSGEVVAPALGLAPLDIGVDDQIAGIGLGATEQFDAEQALQLGENLRRTSAASKPPSSLVLWLALVVMPFAMFAAGVVIMRRRHSELI